MLAEMNTSAAGRDFLSAWEGLRLHPYRCAAGVLTIGVGHALTALERQTGVIVIEQLPTPWRQGLSHDQAAALLSQDLRGFEELLNGLNLTLAQHQFDALISFIFNVGGGAFLRSTLRKKLQRQEWAAIPAQLNLWTKAGGQAMEGLKKRRAAEARLFATADYTGRP